MSTAAKKFVSPAEFLALEAVAEGKHEYFQGEIFAMAGGSPAHNRIVGNLYGRLFQQLDGQPCQPNTSDVMVKVEATGLYTYPDVSVACPPLEREAGGLEVLLNPRVLVEVLSPSRETYDRTVKFRHYRRIPSVTDILLVLQDEPVVEHYRRQAKDVWELTTSSGLDDTVTLASINCRLPLAQIYAQVEFPPPAFAVESRAPH